MISVWTENVIEGSIDEKEVGVNCALVPVLRASETSKSISTEDGFYSLHDSSCRAGVYF